MGFIFIILLEVRRIMNLTINVFLLENAIVPVQIL